MRAFAILALIVACESKPRDRGPPDTGPIIDGAPTDATDVRCTGSSTGYKIKLARETSCQNDGGVELCIPDNDPALQAMITAIAPTITCAAGGGRAGCLRMPGLLLCSYPTRYPVECMQQSGGPMTIDAWANLCELSALPQVTAIVPTILD